MIPARALAPPPNSIDTPPRVTMRGIENDNPKEPEAKTTASAGGLWSYFNFYWVFTTQIPRGLFLASSNTRELRCSPRSYSQEMDDIHLRSTDLQLRTAYLKKALETIPLNVLQTSLYFWGHDNFDLICKLLANDAPKFRQLIELTPSEKYNYFPGHCTTKLQIEVLLDDAFDNETKLQQLTDIILTMIGEPRNGDDLDSLYYFYLKLLILRKESDAYVADRIRACKNVLQLEQVTALKKIENAPLIAQALEEIEKAL
ncbi:MAG TPA: hypothetical protein VIJ14_03985 [Rhabdochlamydiaceae bacterium]